MKLSGAMMRKYRNVEAEIKGLFGDRPVGSITPDEIRDAESVFEGGVTRLDRRFEDFVLMAHWRDGQPVEVQVR